MGVVWPALTPQRKDRPGNVRERCRMHESSCGCCTRSLNIGFGRSICRPLAPPVSDRVEHVRDVAQGDYVQRDWLFDGASGVRETGWWHALTGHASNRGKSGRIGLCGP
jgi:hypothetical protein